MDSKDLECGLLGAFLLDEKLIDEIPDNFGAEHFSIPVYGRIYSAIVALHDKGRAIDPFTINAELNSDEEFHAIGGPNFCVDLINAAVGFNIKEYIDIIIDFYLRREVKKISIEMNYEAENKFGDTEAIDIIDKFEQQLYNLSNKHLKSQVVQFRTVLNTVIKTSTKISDNKFHISGLNGITSGFKLIDEHLGGFNKSDLIILAGRPSMGKTALALNIAFNAAKAKLYNNDEGAAVIFFSLEMSAEQLATRLLSCATGISVWNIKRGALDSDSIKLCSEFYQEMENLELYIEETPSMTSQQIKHTIRKMISNLRSKQNGVTSNLEDLKGLRQNKNIGLVIIDYLQLMSDDSYNKRDSNRVQEISKITRQLKSIAKELDIPVIALSQLSRAVEQREDKRPQLADLRDSGSIEQDADIVMFVYREAYYKSRQEPKINTPEHDRWIQEMNEIKNKAEVIVAKYRNGSTGTIPLFFNPQLKKFGNLSS